MAIAFVNRANDGNTAGATTMAAPATSHTTGNALIAIVYSTWASAASDSTVADTAGNTYTPVAAGVVQQGNNAVEIFYAYNITGHASNVVTATYADTVSYRAITVLQFSGLGTSDPLEDSDSATGNGTTQSTPTLTRTSSDALIVAGGTANLSQSGGAGYTYNNFGITGDANTYFCDEYKIVGADEAPTATCDSSDWVFIGASFESQSVVDLKITQLSALTDPVLTDQLVMADDPGGSAVNKKFTVASLITTFGWLTADAVQVKAAGSGTYTPTSGMKQVMAVAVGPGGDGAGGVNTDSSGGGGGGGGTCVRLLSAANIGVSKAYVVGAGGSGTATTLDGGTLMSAGAGGNGTAGAGSTTTGLQTAGGTGGTASAGDLNSPGEAGGRAVQFDGTNGMGGKGGRTWYGRGAAPGGSNVAGNNGQAYGSGGSGGHASATANRDGGTGADGVLFFFEWIN